ncbi:MAG: TatD family hydrolase [Gammaproteobacteria bacterium]
MNLTLIDIGSNLTHDSFARDREAVITRASEAGVRAQVVTGADAVSSAQAAALAAAHPGVLWSTAGVHPHHAASLAASREALAALLPLPQVVAAGECGLDYCRNFSPHHTQRAAFAAQLEMAAAAAKPVFLHQRDAHADFVAILKDYRRGLVGGVAHCFTGGRDELADYLALDLHIGVTGWVNDQRRGQSLREALPHIPSDRLMVETDAPYLLPRDLKPAPKSRRNEPSLLPHIVRTIAQLRGESFDDLAGSTTRNAIQFFGLDALSERGLQVGE